MGAEIEEQIENYIDSSNNNIPLLNGENIGTATDYIIGRNRYVGNLISVATRSYVNMRIGLDCANGSAFTIVKSIFDSLGAKTYVIGNEPNGININVECGSTNIEYLKHYVLEHKLDVGFAFDGDADRCIAVDEYGNVINGDHILYMIMSNYGLFKALEKNGIDYVTTTVGDKYVDEEIVKNGYSLGGEQSGHIIFSKYATTGDGILTSLMIMEAILEQKTTLGNLARELRLFPQKTRNILVKDKKVVTGNIYVQQKAKQITELLGDNGRILIRKSGTEPVIRIMVEAKEDILCDKYIDEVVTVMHKYSLI